jgi:hypothetical protein
MTLSMQILKEEANGLKTKSVRVLVRNGNAVREAEIIIGLDVNPETIDPQMAWDKGVNVNNPIHQWNAYQLRASDELYTKVIEALLEQVRAKGTLADLINAGRSVLAENSEQLEAFNRLTTALKTGSPAQQLEFMALIALILNSKLGKP